MSKILVLAMALITTPAWGLTESELVSALAQYEQAKKEAIELSEEDQLIIRAMNATGLPVSEAYVVTARYLHTKTAAHMSFEDFMIASISEGVYLCEGEYRLGRDTDRSGNMILRGYSNQEYTLYAIRAYLDYHRQNELVELQGAIYKQINTMPVEELEGMVAIAQEVLNKRKEK